MLLCLSTIALLATPVWSATASPGFLNVTFGKKEPHKHSVARRADNPNLGSIVDASLVNLKTYYAMKFDLGTPGQNLELLIDTGSSDFWVMSPNVEVCQDGSCAKGSAFDNSKSSTFSRNDTSFFQQYGDGTTAKGYWAQDVLNFAGAEIPNFNFAFAEESTSDQSVAGIGLAKGESPYSLNQIDAPYDNLPIQMKQNGYIQRVAYSLYLDHASDATGTLVFGGINKNAYTGDLYKFPIVPVDSNEITRLAIKLDSVFLVNDNGDSEELAATSFSVVLDSGSTIGMLPEGLVRALAQAVGAYYHAETGMALVNCKNLENNRGGVGFTFSGIDFVISFQDLLIKSNAASDICALGFQAGSIPLLGDNVLRSMYVVYDLEGQEIALAKAKPASNDEPDFEPLTSELPATKAPRYSDVGMAGAYEIKPVTIFGPERLGTLVVGGTTHTFPAGFKVENAGNPQPSTKTSLSPQPTSTKTDGELVLTNVAANFANSVSSLSRNTSHAAATLIATAQGSNNTSSQSLPRTESNVAARPAFYLSGALAGTLTVMFLLM